MTPDPHRSAPSGVAPIPVDAAFTALLEQGQVGLAIFDRDLRFVVVNDALAAMNDLPPGHHAGHSIHEVVPPETAAQLEPLMRRVLAGETLHALELTPAGGPDTRRFRATYVPLREGGEVTGVLAVVADVTATSRIEQALRVTEERLHLALEGTGTGIYEWDISENRVRWSDNLGPVYGYPRGWAPADYAEWLQLVHPDDRGRVEARVEAALASPDVAYEVEFRGLCVSGVARWMSTRGHVLRDADGRPLALVGLVSDVHARRTTQQTVEFLAAVSVSLAESPDLEQAIGGLGELARRYGIARDCTVHLLESGGLVPAAEEGLAAVVDQRRAAVVDGVAIVPIIAHGDALGAVTLELVEGGEFEERTLTTMEELGRRVGLAVVNERLQRAQQATTRRLLQLQTVTDVTLSRLSLDDLLYELLRRIRDVLEADLAVCLLLDPDEHALRERAAIGFSAPRVDLLVPLGEGIAGRIAIQDDAVTIDDVPGAHPVSEKLAHEAQSLLGVPLQVDGRTLGVLHVASRDRRTFTRDEADLLRLVGDRVARAVAQADAYETAQATALTLQRSLLPARLPEIDGYGLAERYLPGQAGLEIGGDWYDVIDLADGRYAICVGDVVGRGVTAAAIMARVRAGLRALLRVTSDAARALELLDELVVASEADPFVTVVLALLEPSSGRLELCSAGHPAPVLVSGGTGRVLELPVGPPIGSAAAELGTLRREVAVAQLPVDGVLLLYTDGLVERRGEGLDERFAALCAAAASGPDEAEALLDHVVAAMLGDRTAADDVALVGVLRHR
jgi:sigma-B regulation protein RsbU (phosphoserine phosphatase)